MMRSGQMLDIIFKREATGFSDKLDVKHESKRFCVLFCFPEHLEEWNYHLLRQERRQEFRFGGKSRIQS